MDFLLGNSGLMTQKSLNYLWEKQSIIADNIANSDTPGFQARYVTFEDELKSKLSSGGEQKTQSEVRNDILGTQMQIHTTQDESNRLDGNNVNVDVESMEMARTTLQYEYLVKAFDNDYSRLRSVIQG